MSELLPQFKARTNSNNKIDCPWCGHSSNFLDNPSNFLPDHNEDYHDEIKSCAKCKKTFYLSCEVSIDYTFTSRYKPAAEFENYNEAFDD